MGTNNLSNKNQTANETVKEITDIANACHNTGVNKVYVSGLTCRPLYQAKINKINRLLRTNVVTRNFEFIDNENIIHHKHLWRDKLHLNKEGIILLANNFLHFLNICFTFECFTDIRRNTETQISS